jgi:hypothetical protein
MRPSNTFRFALFGTALVTAAVLTSVMLWRGPSAAAPQNSPRLDVPFTLSVPSPHVSWGKPSALPPVHAFVVPSVSEGRTLVELAQRMDLTFDTVMIDEAWDVNTWTVGTDKDYEARNYKLAYQYLEEDLAKPTQYDVIVLPSLHGWNRLPRSARESIRKRVEQGTGLVLIHPTTGVPAPDDPPAVRPLNDFSPEYEVEPGDELWDLSPLVGVLSDRLDSRGHRQIRPDAVATGPWKRVAEHPISSNLPLDILPTDYLKHYRYKLGQDSTVLIAGPEGEPIVATKMVGKGRVVAIGYVNTGLSPMIEWGILGQHDDHWWEYIYSLLCRSILWTAGREPVLRLLPMAITDSAGGGKAVSVTVDRDSPLERADAMAQVFNEWGELEGSAGRTLELQRGVYSVSIDLPANLAGGRHTVDVILTAEGKRHDWGSITFGIEKPDEVVRVAADRSFYTRGDKLQARFSTRTAKAFRYLVELFDNRHRLIGRQGPSEFPAGTSEIQTEVSVGNYTTNIGWLRVTLLGALPEVSAATKSPQDSSAADRVLDRKQLRVNFQSLDREFGAYEFIMPWHGPPSYQPWTPTLDEQFRKIGITVTERPERNFRLIAGTKTPGFGVYWHYRHAYLEQKKKFLETGDKRYLVRDPDLADDAWLEKLRAIMREDMQRSVLYRPLGWYMADESSLTAYGDPFDLSWSEPTLAKFRDWLKTQYASLDALNAEWESSFPGWEDVLPLTTAEAQAKGNCAGWFDHRVFMEDVFAHALQVAADTVREVDPGGRPSISGTQVPGPSNAVNWYKLDQIIDYLQPYSHGDQDELHRITRPDLILTGFTGYEDHGKVLRHQLWHRLFHGHIGASLFWHYTALNADLTLTEQGNDLAETTNEFRDEGLGLLLRGAQRENCGIAVHYSLHSVKGHWITDGHIAPNDLASGEATSAHLKRFHANRKAWLLALEDAGYQYDLLTTEQMEAGRLADYRVLVLPDSIALSDQETSVIRRFVENGGLLIADAETGLMNGHGRWQVSGRIDDVLGVQRVRIRSVEDEGPRRAFRVALSSGSAELEVVPADAGLRLTTGHPGAATGETLFLMDNRYGSGRAFTLNFWMTDYEGIRKSSAQAARLNLLRDHMSLAGVRPVADIRRSNGATLACSQVIAFRKGMARYLAILPEPGCADEGAVNIRLPEPRHAYDLRAHRSLGRTTRIDARLVAGEPLLLAFLPAPVGKIKVSPADERISSVEVKAGETARFSVRLAAASGSAATISESTIPPSAAHVEVRNPQGNVLDHYTANLPLVDGQAEFSVPLALSDHPGRWRVTVREPYTHATATMNFVVTR